MMTVIDAKVVILGKQGVGKTSVIVRKTANIYNQHISPTIGASFFSCNMHMDNCQLRLQIWDTAGQERFRAMAPMYYRNADAAFIVFDISSYESYMGMKTWAEELRQHVDGFVYVCILGNKCDLEMSRQVKSEEAQEYANSMGAAYIETSAQNNIGIGDAFEAISKGIIRITEDSGTRSPSRDSVSGKSQTLGLGSGSDNQPSCC